MKKREHDIMEIAIGDQQLIAIGDNRIKSTSHHGIAQLLQQRARFFAVAASHEDP